MNRFEIAKGLDKEAETLSHNIVSEIKSYKPIGRLTELQEVMRLLPKRGVAVGTPFGTYIFAKGNCPSDVVANNWHAMYNRVQELYAQTAKLCVGIVIGNDRTIGNRKFLESALALQAQGLTTEEENQFITKLQTFWQLYPDAKCGIVKGETIEPLDY